MSEKEWEYNGTVYHLKIRVFWNVAPCSLVRVHRRFRGELFLHHQGARIMEAGRPSETAVQFNVTTRRYTPEDSKLHTRSCLMKLLQDNIYKCRLKVANKCHQNVAMFKYLETTLAYQRHIHEEINNSSERLSPGNTCYHAVRKLLFPHLVSELKG
jgi:hypothetical protein